MNGFALFVKEFRKRGIPLTIISHKSKYNPYDNLRRDLQKPAKNWMMENNFFNKTGLSFNCNQICFTSSDEEKIDKIRTANCTHFVDDLLKILLHPSFPKETKKILFMNRVRGNRNLNLDYAGDWRGITNFLKTS